MLDELAATVAQLHAGMADVERLVGPVQAQEQVHAQDQEQASLHGMQRNHGQAQQQEQGQAGPRSVGGGGREQGWALSAYGSGGGSGHVGVEGGGVKWAAVRPSGCTWPFTNEGCCAMRDTWRSTPAGCSASGAGTCQAAACPHEDAHEWSQQLCAYLSLPCTMLKAAAARQLLLGGPCASLGHSTGTGDASCTANGGTCGTTACGTGGGYACGTGGGCACGTAGGAKPCVWLWRMLGGDSAAGEGTTLLVELLALQTALCGALPVLASAGDARAPCGDADQAHAASSGAHLVADVTPSHVPRACGGRQRALAAAAAGSAGVRVPSSCPLGTCDASHALLALCGILERDVTLLAGVPPAIAAALLLPQPVGGAGLGAAHARSVDASRGEPDAGCASGAAAGAAGVGSRTCVPGAARKNAAAAEAHADAASNGTDAASHGAAAPGGVNAGGRDAAAGAEGVEAHTWAAARARLHGSFLDLCEAVARAEAARGRDSVVCGGVPAAREGAAPGPCVQASAHGWRGVASLLAQQWQQAETHSTCANYGAGLVGDAALCGEEPRGAGAAAVCVEWVRCVSRWLCALGHDPMQALADRLLAGCSP